MTNVNLTGVSATGSAGAVKPSVSPSLSSVSATGSAGSFSIVGSSSSHLTGAFAQSMPGIIVRVVQQLVGQSDQIIPIPYYGPADYQNALLNLLPIGRAWSKYPDSNLFDTIGALIGSYARSSPSQVGDNCSAFGSSLRATDLLLDTMPVWSAIGAGAVTEQLDVWQLTLGLPDPCLGVNPSLDEQIRQCVARFVSLGGQSIDFYTTYAANLGFAISINEFAPFRTDISVADSLLFDEAEFFVWQVVSEDAGQWLFETDINTADEPLGSFGNTVLECEIERLAPAHTFVYFAYLSVGSGGGVGPPPPLIVPLPAIDAGFTYLAFFDDFVTDTVAPSTSPGSGYNWYWGDVSNTMTAADFTVNTTATAGSIANGNVGAGPNPSPIGGILTINPAGATFALTTIPGWTLNTGADALPSLGTWQHAYVEIYMQTKINGNLSSSPSNGWPVVWSWAAEGLQSYGFSSSSLNAADVTEVDIFQTYGDIFGNTPGQWYATLEDTLLATAAGGLSGVTLDDNFHTFGWLWEAVSPGVGSVSFFMDNVLQTVTNGGSNTSFATGTGSSMPALENQHSFLILKTGITWEVNIDYVRVWTAPPGAVLSPPPQAIAAGFHTSAFFDDFTSNTVAPSAASASGYNWYWVAQVDTYVSHVGSWTVNTGTFAGGSNASPAGGVLTMNTQRGGFPDVYWGNSVLASAPVQTMNTTFTGQSFGHGYFEFYAQSPIISSPSGLQSEGWPAVWSWGSESVQDGGFGSNITNGNDITEVDFMELYGGVFGDPSGFNQFNVEVPAGGSTVYSATYPPADTGWHTYGLLWVPGTIKIYYDNVLVATQSTAGWTLEGTTIFWLLGTGINWPLNIDWIRVWQAP